MVFTAQENVLIKLAALLYDATLLPPLETPALHTLRVAVLLSVVLRIKYIHTKGVLSEPLLLLCSQLTHAHYRLCIMILSVWGKRC